MSPLSREQLILSIHHIGGRAGTRPFPQAGKLESNLQNVLYEADTSCIPQMHDAVKVFSSEQVILPYCIADKQGKTPFYLRGSRYNSSMFKRPEGYVSHYMYNPQFGWDEDPTSRGISEVVELETVSLDQLFKGAQPPPALPPHFLSIDAEGAEFAILKGAERVLREHTLMVQVETSLIPNWEGAGTFADIQNYLATLGFTLHHMDMFDYQGNSPNRYPIGTRSGRGGSTMGEATFIKKRGVIAAEHSEPALDLLKLSLFCLLHDWLEKGYDLLDAALEQGAEAILQQAAETGSPFLSFMERLAALLAEHPEVYPLLYRQFFPDNDAQRDRFNQDPLAPGSDALRKAYFSEADAKVIRDNLSWLMAEEATELEQLFLDNQSITIAENLRNARLNQIIDLLSLLGLAKNT
uniref:Methyltransferase FkbM domain-containing protein n=1 Tax=Magnetococcus massalia (strain MO-1) TaxID=451514 RepID=A0A1S7LMN6_MAGMO|nr:Protein of unknown function. Containing methyltransferase domain [Candidatus Magnetococcus massalia]